MVDGVNGDLGELATNKLQNKQDTEIVTIHHHLMEELLVLALTEMNQAVKVDTSMHFLFQLIPFASLSFSWRLSCQLRRVPPGVRC